MLYNQLWVYLNSYIYLIFCLTLFFIGIFGILIIRQNIIIIFIAIELSLLAINLNFLFFSWFLNDIMGQVFVIYILTVIGAEAAVGLGLLLLFYRIRGIININEFNTIKS